MKLPEFSYFISESAHWKIVAIFLKVTHTITIYPEIQHLGIYPRNTECLHSYRKINFFITAPSRKNTNFLNTWRAKTMVVQVSPTFLSSCYSTSLSRPTSVPASTSRKKSGEDVRFYDRGRRVKTASSGCFAASQRGGSPEWPAASQAPSQGRARGTSAKPPELRTVCEHLCFISVSLVHPLARCVLRYHKSLRGVFFKYGNPQDFSHIN